MVPRYRSKTIAPARQGKASRVSLCNELSFAGRRHLYTEFIEAIRHARKYIYITTPYFVPTRRLARVLRLAALRNVDVKIIMPETSNHPFVDVAARTFFSSMLHPRTFKNLFISRGKYPRERLPSSTEIGLLSAP